MKRNPTSLRCDVGMSLAEFFAGLRGHPLTEDEWQEMREQREHWEWQQELMARKARK